MKTTVNSFLITRLINLKAERYLKHLSPIVSEIELNPRVSATSREKVFLLMETYQDLLLAIVVLLNHKGEHNLSSTFKLKIKSLGLGDSLAALEKSIKDFNYYEILNGLSHTEAKLIDLLNSLSDTKIVESET